MSTARVKRFRFGATNSDLNAADARISAKPKPAAGRLLSAAAADQLSTAAMSIAIVWLN